VPRSSALSTATRPPCSPRPPPGTHSCSCCRRRPRAFGACGGAGTLRGRGPTGGWRGARRSRPCGRGSSPAAWTGCCPSTCSISRFPCSEPARTSSGVPANQNIVINKKLLFYSYIIFYEKIMINVENMDC